MTTFKLVLFNFVLIAAFTLSVPAAPRCVENAKSDALKLLKFHVNGDERAELDKNATQLAPITNPANKKQKFDVIEVWGYVYKGQYRLRMIYYFLQGDCVLMGQEILEHANV